MNRKLLPLIAILLLLSTTVVVNAQSDNRLIFRLKLRDADPETLAHLERMIENYIKFRTILSGVNIILYSYLLHLYYTLYNETSSKFSLGLTVLSGVLLLYSITSNPLSFLIFRRTNPIWVNLFSITPDLFASIAAFIMIYLSRI